MVKKILALIMALSMLTLPSIGASEIMEIPVDEVMDIVKPIYPITLPESSEKELTQAILTFKNIFGDTDEYKNFYHYINEYNGVKIFHLYWNEDTSNNQISASVGTNGIIYSYNYYDNNTSSKHIPNFFKDEALEIAYEFIKTIVTDEIESISKDYAMVSYNSYQGSYNVTFYRMANDLLVENESISVGIGQDKKVISYYRDSFSTKATYPDVPKLLEKDDVLNSLNENLPFELVYRTIYPNGYNNKAIVKLFYQVNSKAYSQVINAETGKLFNVENNYSYIPAGGAKTADSSVAEELSIRGVEYELTEVEKVAVDLQKSFVTVDDITKTLLNIDEINFNDNYKVSNSHLSTQKSPYTHKETYEWYVTYINDNGDSAKTVAYAETGEIKSYVSQEKNAEYKAINEYKNKYQDAVTAVDIFMTKYFGDKFSEFKLDKYEYSDDQKLSSYYYNYKRYVNDIEFSDTAGVMVNPDTLEITSFELNYSDAKFPPTEKVITPTKAAEKYWDFYGLTPYYTVYDDIKDNVIHSSIGSYSNTEKYMMPVYSYKYTYNYIDALTGKVVKYNGEDATYVPIKYYKSNVFIDIEGHEYENEIYVLSQIDAIKNDTDKYEPDKSITQDEFSDIISVLGFGYRPYYGVVVETPSSNTRVIVKSDDTLTREAAIKILVTNLGYSEIAELSSIFDVSYFTDADKISDDHIGYIAIAKGMGLLDTFGEKLSPKSKLTKGEAAYIAYQYLMYKTEMAK